MYEVKNEVQKGMELKQAREWYDADAGTRIRCIQEMYPNIHPAALISESYALNPIP
jgi:hypothetical protein